MRWGGTVFEYGWEIMLCVRYGWALTLAFWVEGLEEGTMRYHMAFGSNACGVSFSFFSVTFCKFVYVCRKHKRR